MVHENAQLCYTMYVFYSICYGFYPLLLSYAKLYGSSHIHL